MNRNASLVVLSVISFTIATLNTDFVAAQDAVPQSGDVVVETPSYSPYAGRQFPTRVYWGDTHLHTAISVDAGTMCRLGQEDALRFARGEEVTTTHGLKAKLSRPLDFLVVSDHAEMYGLMPQLLKGDPKILATKQGKRWYDMIKSGDKSLVFKAAMEMSLRSAKTILHSLLTRS